MAEPKTNSINDRLKALRERAEKMRKETEQKKSKSNGQPNAAPKAQPTAAKTVPAKKPSFADRLKQKGANKK